MAPAALAAPASVKKRGPSPSKKAWNEDRQDIPSILIGGGQENASTARHNLEQTMDSLRKPVEKMPNRHRTNSLRNVKNSNEVLRQRSIQKVSKEAGETDKNISMREGRHFTVTSVGNNGKLYLR